MVGNFKRCPSTFSHHPSRVARLNAGSFGSPSEPVLQAATRFRNEWLAQPDALYFSGKLAEQLQNSERAAARALGKAPVERVSLVENATVATAIVVKRWQKEDASKKKILALSTIYGGCRRSLEISGLPIVYADIPFPGTTHEKILQSLEAALKAHKPSYIYLDHVSSQPAITMPLKAMIELCRRTPSVSEIAIDAAHALGNVARSITIEDYYDVDFYFTNLHKWAFAAPTVCAFYSRLPLTHVVPSWDTGNFQQECRWSGTRDYAAFVSASDALEYLERWRSPDQHLDAAAYNHQGLAAAAADLRLAWNVDTAYDETDCASAMGMVRLPPSIDLTNDRPGVPDLTGQGIRSRLRSQYNIEAAVAAFQCKKAGEFSSIDTGEEGFIRLSHAVYTSDTDIHRLRDAILELSEENRNTGNGINVRTV